MADYFLITTSVFGLGFIVNILLPYYNNFVKSKLD